MYNELKNKYQNPNILNEFPKPKWWLSWPVIIIFPFAAPFLLWKRAAIDKTAALVFRFISAASGYFCLFIAFICILSIASNEYKSGQLLVVLFFLLVGIGLIKLSVMVRDRINNTNKYILAIVEDGISDIDDIAAAIPTSYENAVKDLQKMLDRGFFENAYIDKSIREIILPELDVEEYDEEYDNEEYDGDGNEDVSIELTCKSCGANNIIISGTVGECEYCGSIIKAT